jgi:propionate catabolism operon transcriptional regulator
MQHRGENMKIRVLAIAPYPGLKDLLLEMVKKEPSIHMDVEVADLHDAIPLVEQAEARGYRIVVSRGGTANLIRKHTALPVVEIPVSGYDILRILTLVRNANSKVAIIGFPNICRGVSEVSSLLDFEIPTFAIERPSEVGEALKLAFQSDVKMVLGDVVTVRAAQDMGYYGILITSGQESVDDMFREVRRVYDVYKKGQAEALFYRHILDKAPRGVFVLDTNKRVLYMNPAAGQIIGKTDDMVYGTSINLAFPGLSKLIQQFQEMQESNALLQQFLLVNDEQFKVSIMAHGSSSDFDYLIYMDSLENWRNDQRFSAYIPSRLATFNQLIGSSPILRKEISRGQKYALSDRNVWISGERGAGKSIFAQAIHSASKRHDQGFYMISCDVMTEQELEQLLSGSTKEPGLMKTGFSGTLYFNNIDRLGRAAQEKWLHVIRNYKRIRFIASSSTTMARLKSKADFSQDLIIALGELHITVPPLRDRMEDLDEIIRVFIAEYNSQSGKQIVGLRDLLMEKLMQYEWAGNLRELKNVIQEMLILTKGNYVEPKEGVAVLERHKQAPANPAASSSYAPIDLGGTLEDIEQRIIWQVLQEEGMNQSKTCKRLGINRTTLWRKINKMMKNET